LHNPDTERAVEDTDAKVVSRRDPQNVQEVIGARTRKRDTSSRVSAADLTGLEQNEIHDLVFIM
jgi:hypothetical protein